MVADQQILMFEGDKVRLLLRGVQTHSVAGTVVSSDHEGLSLLRDDTGTTTWFPEKAIANAEVDVVLDGRTRSMAGVLPPPLAEALEPLNQLFRTGTGGLQKDLARSVAESRAVLSEVEASLISPDIRGLVDNVSRALDFIEATLGNRSYEDLNAQRRVALKHLDPDLLILAGETTNKCDPLRGAMSRLSLIIDRDWKSLTETFIPKPVFSKTKDSVVLHVSRSGDFDIPIRIELGRKSSPAQIVEVLIAESDPIEILGEIEAIPELRPGDTHTVTCRGLVNPSSMSGPISVRLRAQLRYQTVTGQRQSAMQYILYELIPAVEFAEIENPYRAYSGGTAVDDPEMFFGREKALSEILHDLTKGPVGQGIALYGQKRSGKTSLLKQINSRLEDTNCVPISLSIGALDRVNLTASFVRAILRRLRVSLYSVLKTPDIDRLLLKWPTDEAIEERPLESLEDTMLAGRTLLKKYPGNAGVRYVLLIDEFTYLYEILRDPDYASSTKQNVKEFLRQWKSLLERGLFSSVLVGQDTLPYFTQSFPNEFSSMRLVHLSYLSEMETSLLSDRPILRPDGRSRHSGFSLEAIFAYTAGHPYFTQMLLDRIVENANRQERSEVSEHTVEEAANSMLSGNRLLSPHVFDCLLTADNSGLVFRRDGSEILGEQLDEQKGLAYGVLAQIAARAGTSERRVGRQELELAEIQEQVLNDLVSRGVVDRHDGYQINVHLFGEYLRRNS